MFKFRLAIASVYCVGALCLLPCAMSGCAGTLQPTWCSPWSEKDQIALAKKFDPYPDPTIGPAVVGGRPLAYLDPRPNPDLTKITTSATPFSAPPAPMYGAPVVYPPPAATYPPPGVYLPPAAAAPPMSAAPMMANPQPVTMVAPSQAVPWTGAQPPTATSLPPNSGGALPIAYGKALGTP